MIPTRMVLHGFQSFRDRVEIHFQPGVTAVYGNVTGAMESFGESNGSGKSALITNALSWLLWDRTPDGTRTNDLIHWDASQVYGDITFQGRGGYLRIEKAKTRTSSADLKFNWCGQEYHLDATAGQKKLEEFLGISREVFHNVHVVDRDSDSSRFATATPGERAKLLSRILPYDDLFQAAGTKVQKDISRFENERRTLTGVLATMNQSLLQLQGNLGRLTEQAKAETFRLQQEAAQNARLITQKEEELVRHKQTLASPAKRPVAELQVMRTNALNAAREQQLRIGQAQAMEQLQELGEGTVCPSCLQHVTGVVVAHIRQEREKARRIREEAQVKMGEHSTQAAALEQMIQEALADSQNRRYAEAQIARLDEEIKSLRFVQDNKPQSAFAREAEVLASQITDLRKQIEEKEQEVKNLDNQVPVLRKLAQGFQQDIRNMCLDDTRRVLAHYAEKYRWLLYGDAIRLIFPDTTSTGREKFEILMQTPDGTVNKLPSKGQKYRISLALILALRRVLTYGNRTPFDFIVLDDPVGELDSNGLRTLYRLMSNLTEEIPMVLTTVPQKVEGIFVENEILVQYDGRVSRVVEGGAFCAQ